MYVRIVVRKVHMNSSITRMTVCFYCYFFQLYNSTQNEYKAWRWFVSGSVWILLVPDGIFADMEHLCKNKQPFFLSDAVKTIHAFAKIIGDGRENEHGIWK